MLRANEARLETSKNSVYFFECSIPEISPSAVALKPALDPRERVYWPCFYRLLELEPEPCPDDEEDEPWPLFEDEGL